jgi:hypothetical protein
MRRGAGRSWSATEPQWHKIRRRDGDRTVLSGSSMIGFPVTFSNYAQAKVAVAQLTAAGFKVRVWEPNGIGTSPKCVQLVEEKS